MATRSRVTTRPATVADEPVAQPTPAATPPALTPAIEELRALMPANFFMDGSAPHSQAVFHFKTHARDNRQIVGFEVPPGVYPIYYRPGTGNVGTFEISMPRTLWIMVVAYNAVNQHAKHWLAQHLFPLVIPAPFSEAKLQTRIFRLPLPNIHSYGHGYMCVGRAFNDLPKTDKLGELLPAIHASIMNGIWNTDMSPVMRGIGVTSISGWEKQTKKKADYYKSMKFLPHHFYDLEHMLAGVRFTLNLGPRPPRGWPVTAKRVPPSSVRVYAPNVMGSDRDPDYDDDDGLNDYDKELEDGTNIADRKRRSTAQESTPPRLDTSKGTIPTSTKRRTRSSEPVKAPDRTGEEDESEYSDDAFSQGDRATIDSENNIHKYNVRADRDAAKLKSAVHKIEVTDVGDETEDSNEYDSGEDEDAVPHRGHNEYDDEED